MTVPDLDLLALLAVRLKGVPDTDAVAAWAHVDRAAMGDVLAALAAAGELTRREGRVTGWSLTTLGRIAGEKRLAAELDEQGVRAAVRDAYDRFVALNAGFLGLCTRWLVRADGGEQRPNGHDDPAYDDACRAELAGTDDAAQPLCRDLARALGRFGCYPGRLAHARRRVEAGDDDWFTSPAVDSYHTIWFELHENLLATLGLDRASEAG